MVMEKINNKITSFPSLIRTPTDGSSDAALESGRIRIRCRPRRMPSSSNAQAATSFSTRWPSRRVGRHPARISTAGQRDSITCAASVWSRGPCGEMAALFAVLVTWKRLPPRSAGAGGVQVGSIRARIGPTIGTNPLERIICRCSDCARLHNRRLIRQCKKTASGVMTDFGDASVRPSSLCTSTDARRS